MPIRYITIPEPIALFDPATKKLLTSDELDEETKQPKTAPPVVTKDLVSKLLFNPMWAESYKNIKSAKAIDKAFSDSKPGETVQLADEDWKKLKDLVENPKGGYGYHPAVMPQLLPILEAIVDAKEEKKD